MPKRPTHSQMVKGLCLIAGKSVLPDVKMPRKPRKDRGVHRTTPYRKEEAELRKEVIKYLRENGCRVWRIENGLIGYKGLPDIFLANERIRLAVFVELKRPDGIMSKEQIEFKRLCDICGIKYWVVRSVLELDTLCNFYPPIEIL